MRTTINSVNLELSKEENVALLIEVREVMLENKPIDGFEKYPMLKKLEHLLTENHKVGEIDAQSTSFKLITHQ